MVAPGVFEWTSPHGHRYLRDRHGTTSLDEPGLVTGASAPSSTNGETDPSERAPSSTNGEADPSERAPSSTNGETDPSERAPSSTHENVDPPDRP